METHTLTMRDLRIASAVIAGPRIIESVDAVERVEDWSRVRSPGRARRRMRRGYRQNVEIRFKPAAFTLPNGDMVLHPAVVAELRRQVGDSIRRKLDRMTEGAILGRRV